MRTTLTTLATATLFAALAFAQGQDKTFYFTHPASADYMTAMVTMTRTILDLQNISADREHQAVLMHGPLEKLVAAEWLFDQLDRPASGMTAQYKMFGEKSEVLAIFPLSPAATVPDIAALTTAIRTLADMARLFPYEAAKAIVGRDTPEKVAAANWLVRQLLPYDGKAPTGDSVAYPSPLVDSKAENDKPIVQVFRMDPETTNAQLTATVTAIRTTADLQRLFPFESGKAIIASGASDKVAVAGWLVHELAKPPDANVVHQTVMPGLIDGVVRLFYVGVQADAAPLATQIRSTVGIQRVFPIGYPPAIVLRGRPDQMSTVEALVAKSADVR
jgi:hypothetical protein